MRPDVCLSHETTCLYALQYSVLFNRKAPIINILFSYSQGDEPVVEDEDNEDSDDDDDDDDDAEGIIEHLNSCFVYQLFLAHK